MFFRSLPKREEAVTEICSPFSFTFPEVCRTFLLPCGFKFRLVQGTQTPFPGLRTNRPCPARYAGPFIPRPGPLSRVGSVTISGLWESVAKPLLWSPRLCISRPKLRGVNPPSVVLTDSVDQGCGQGRAGKARSPTRPAVHVGLSAESSAGVVGWSTPTWPACGARTPPQHGGWIPGVSADWGTGQIDFYDLEIPQPHYGPQSVQDSHRLKWKRTLPCARGGKWVLVRWRWSCLENPTTGCPLATTIHTPPMGKVSLCFSL